jgi:uncharacterized OB-fold protein
VCAKDGTILEKLLSKRGKVYSFSYCKVGPPGVTAPYIVGLVQLPEGPRILSIIPVQSPSPGSLSIGDEVELIVGKTGVDEEGRDVINYMFTPVKSEIGS